ncbi:helix-turn-helix domain-containing protein [Paenibacillus sp. MBLB4367]|uniref:AraC family transcriptional regulator n=1 Tax=Paenibacillus sp. MBLB4367 TaxID=3384767 RepID=UPI003908089D
MNIEIRFPNMTSTLQIIGCHFGVKAPGWSYPKHHHHLFELLYCWSGEVRQTINDTSIAFRAGDWLLLKSGVRHQLENVSNESYSFFDVHFDIDDTGMRQLLSRKPFGHIPRAIAEKTRLPEYRNEIERLLQTSLAECSAPGSDFTQVQPSFGDKLAVQGYILLMIQELMPLLQTNDETANGEGAKQASAFEADMAHAIEEKLRSTVYATGAVEEIARELNLSRSQCTKVFVKIYGISPRQYMSQLKLSEAKKLLIGSDMTIEAIAVRLGFGSISHFSRQFRRWTGLSPNQYRPKHSVQQPELPVEPLSPKRMSDG